MRAAAAFAAFGVAAFAPWPLLARAALALNGVYLLFTALAGTCLGYRLIGRSTCPRTQ